MILIYMNKKHKYNVDFYVKTPEGTREQVSMMKNIERGNVGIGVEQLLERMERDYDELYKESKTYKLRMKWRKITHKLTQLLLLRVK